MPTKKLLEELCALYREEGTYCVLRDFLIQNGRVYNPDNTGNQDNCQVLIDMYETDMPDDFVIQLQLMTEHKYRESEKQKKDIKWSGTIPSYANKIDVSTVCG